MKMTVAPTVELPAVSRPRIADVMELTKPRIAVMSLITVAVGYLIGAGPFPELSVLIHTLVGTALVAGGAAALNHWMERDIDVRMRRTENRPIPSGRMRPAEVLVFGATLATVGLAYLLLLGPNVLTAVIAALTLVLYVGVYTPLKPVTTANTLIGAVPGALPPLIGWAAATGSISREGVVLFLILFLWQLPHFFAIAWMYKDEYARAGLRMLPVADPDGRVTARSAILFTLTLIAASSFPVALGMAGPFYLFGAIALGVLFLIGALRFAANRTFDRARKLLFASLIYLPAVLILLVIGR